MLVWRGPSERALDSVVLFVLAITLHNMPEGLAVGVGFAAGAMLFVISDEIVPETHLRGHERVATLGTMAGVIVMLYLDVALA